MGEDETGPVGDGPSCVLCGRPGYLHGPEFNPRLGRGLLVDGATGLRCAAVASCTVRVGENRRTAPDLLKLPWRVGRHVGRTIYAMVNVETSDADVLIGVMDSRELAEAACLAHNFELRHD